MRVVTKAEHAKRVAVQAKETAEKNVMQVEEAARGERAAARTEIQEAQREAKEAQREAKEVSKARDEATERAKQEAKSAVRAREALRKEKEQTTKVVAKVREAERRAQEAKKAQGQAERTGKEFEGQLEAFRVKHRQTEQELARALESKAALEHKLESAVLSQNGMQAGVQQEDLMVNTKELSAQQERAQCMAKYRALLVDLYTACNPSKLAMIEEILCEWAGREDALIESLREKYSHFFGLEDGTSSADTAKVAKYRVMLRALYSLYNPSKLNQVEAILHTWEGNEQELERLLREKYPHHCW
jgi:hypothetical protein